MNLISCQQSDLKAFFYVRNMHNQEDLFCFYRARCWPCLPITQLNAIAVVLGIKQQKNLAPLCLFEMVIPFLLALAVVYYESSSSFGRWAFPFKQPRCSLLPKIKLYDILLLHFKQSKWNFHG